MNEAERYLEERNKPKAVAPAANAPPHEVSGPYSHVQYLDAVHKGKHGWFSLEGRIGRQIYFWRMAAISVGSAAAIWLISMWYGVTLANSLPHGVDFSAVAET